MSDLLAQQAAFDAKEKEIRQMQEAERIRMAEDKKQEMERQGEAHQSVINQMSQHCSTTLAGWGGRGVNRKRNDSTYMKVWLIHDIKASNSQTTNLNSLQDSAVQYAHAQDTDRFNTIHARHKQNQTLCILSLFLPMHTPFVQQLIRTVSLNRPRSGNHYVLNMLTPAIKIFITIL